MAEVQRFRAGTVVVTSGDVRSSSEVTVVGGRIERVRPVAEMTAEERATTIAPAWIDAHAHLDLGALRGAVPPGEGFVDWVGALLRARGEAGAEALRAGAVASADALVATGTATVLDVDSIDVAGDALAGHPLRRVALIELIDGSPASADGRTADALARADAALARGDGWSPHGVHTVGEDLLAGLSERARAAGPLAPPTAIHWAESPEEIDWLLRGGGRFAPLLGPSPGCSGLARLARHGLLDGAMLVHGNHPQPDELALLADARGSAVVHCPGSHAFFGRAPFPLRALEGAGASLLLGTDSWASNDALDMRREVRLARASLGLDARAAFEAATRRPARWVADPAVTGTLDEGSAADLVRYSHDGRALDALEALTARSPAVLETRIAGEVAFRA